MEDRWDWFGSSDFTHRYIWAEVIVKVVRGRGPYRISGKRMTRQMIEAITTRQPRARCLVQALGRDPAAGRERAQNRWCEPSRRPEPLVRSQLSRASAAFSSAAHALLVRAGLRRATPRNFLSGAFPDAVDRAQPSHRR